MKQHFVEHEKRVQVQKTIDSATDLMVRGVGASIFFAIVSGFSVNTNDQIFTVSIIASGLGFLYGIIKGIEVINAEEALKKMRGD